MALAARVTHENGPGVTEGCLSGCLSHQRHIKSGTNPWAIEKEMVQYFLIDAIVFLFLSSDH